MDVELARDASAQEFGRSLKRFGINLLVKEVEKTQATVPAERVPGLLRKHASN